MAETVNAEKEYDQIQQKIADLKSQLLAVEDMRKSREEEAAPLKTLISWEAPDRIFDERSRSWFVVVSFIFMVGIAFAAVTKELLLIVAMIGLMFLIYLSSTIKPQLVKHEITNKGIKSGKDIWQWNEIKGFWLGRRGKHDILFIDLEGVKTPNRLMLLLGTANPKQIVELLIRHVSYLNKKQIGEDLINVFTLGTYRPITDFVETNGGIQVQTPKKATAPAPVATEKKPS
jgi:hypothetical protein